VHGLQLEHDVEREWQRDRRSSSLSLLSLSLVVGDALEQALNGAVVERVG